jgi:hypothetical protein
MRSEIRELMQLEQADWASRMEALIASGTPLNADTASFSAAMKTKFIGPIRDGLHKGKVLLFGDADANPEQFGGIVSRAEGIDFVGNEFRIPIKASRNQAVGFRSENGTLPSPGASTYTYLTEPMRSAYGVFNITGQLLKASETNEGAFKQAFKEELDDTVLSSKLDFNRAAFGAGVGTMATVRTSEAAAQTVIDVDTTINFRGGEVISGVTLATGVVIEPARTVTAVDRVNRTITVTPALTTGLTANTDGWVRASSSDTAGAATQANNSWNKEIQGLQSLISSTGTLHGINPATYPFWKSYQAAVAGPIADSVLRDAIDGVGFESGVDLEGGDFAIVTTRGIRRRYADTLLSVKRFNDAQSVKLHGGFTAVMFDEHPIFTDDQCPVGNVFGLSLKDLFWASESDWEWMDQDGSVLKHEAGKDRYIAYLFAYKQLGLTRRNSHFRLTGVTDDVR